MSKTIGDYKNGMMIGATKKEASDYIRSQKDTPWDSIWYYIDKPSEGFIATAPTWKGEKGFCFRIEDEIIVDSYWV